MSTLLPSTPPPRTPLPRIGLALPLLLSALAAGTARGQDHSHHVVPTPIPSVEQADHAAMGHSADDQARSPAPTSIPQGNLPVTKSPVDHSKMDHSKRSHTTEAKPTAGHVDHSQVDHSQMDHSQMDHSRMGHAAMGHAAMAAEPDLPREPIPPLTAADRAAAFPTLQRHMAHDSGINSFVLFNRLEAWDAEHGDAQAWEAQAWVGTDIDRVWVRSEGERVDGRLHSANAEVLYGRSVSAWWDVVAGVRRDFQPDGRTWAAIGLQGLAPYMFETQATLYLGNGGHVEATIEVEYELLLTNRLILQPLVELDFASKDDPGRGVGSGLSSMEAGLRVRYEISRRFAPYVGVVHERSFGDASRWQRAAGESPRDTRVVAGVRVWF